MRSLLCVWNQYLKYVESSATNFVLVMRASRGLISIQYTRRVGRNGTLEATRGAPVPAIVMSGRLLKSEMMRTILGRNLCRVSSICCIRKFETATNTLVVQPLNWTKNSFLYATPPTHLQRHPLHSLNLMSGHILKKIWAKLTVILTRQPVGIQASSDKETNCERVDLAAEMIEELLLVWGFWDITSRQRLIKGSSRGCNSSLYDLHTQKYAYPEVTVYNTTKFARHCNKKEKGKIYSYPGADSVTHVSFQSDVSVFLYTRSWAKLSRTWRDETQ